MEIKFILESLLFSAQRPMSVKELREVFVNAATEENPDEAAKPFKKIKGRRPRYGAGGTGARARGRRPQLPPRLCGAGRGSSSRSQNFRHGSRRLWA